MRRCVFHSVSYFITRSVISQIPQGIYFIEKNPHLCRQMWVLFCERAAWRCVNGEKKAIRCLFLCTTVILKSVFEEAHVNYFSCRISYTVAAVPA